MERKVIITKWNGKVLTSVLEENEIVEFHCSDFVAENENRHMLGNIYVGRVKNIVSNISAAFIEIAPGVECYYAINQNENPIFTHKVGKKPLCVGDELIVQISREASKTKVSTVTSKLEFVGTYTVLTYGNLRVGASKKLKKERRLELKSLLEAYQNDVFGLVARTNAGNGTDEELRMEIERLSGELSKLLTSAQTRKCFSCLKQAMQPYIADVRNLYGDGLMEIKVEDSDIYNEIKKYLLEEQPQNLDKLVYYTEHTFPLAKLYNLEREIEKALKERVWLKCGGYLVIQPTEALTVIDVNSGKYVAKKSEDASYLKINLEAAEEVAKQIRLRNLSGIILVDFINLNQEEDIQLLIRKLRANLSKDPIQTTLVDITKLHLVEITRKKVRKMLYETI